MNWKTKTFCLGKEKTPNSGNITLISVLRNFSVWMICSKHLTSFCLPVRDIPNSGVRIRAVHQCLFSSLHLHDTLYRHIHGDNDRRIYFLQAFQFPWNNSGPLSYNICRATYRCWRGAWSMWQRMSSVFHPPMNEIGSRAGEDRTSPNVHGDAHHVVRGNGCRRGCRCSHLSSTSLRFEIGSCAARGVNLSFGVVGVGGSSVKGTTGLGCGARAHGEELTELICQTMASAPCAVL